MHMPLCGKFGHCILFTPLQFLHCPAQVTLGTHHNLLPIVVGSSQIRPQGTNPPANMVANIFSNLCFTEGQKASFSLKHEFQLNSQKNIITIRRANLRISSLRTPCLSFGLETDQNLAETVIPTFPAQKNQFSIVPWLFHNSLVFDFVHFGLVNCYNLQIQNWGSQTPSGSTWVSFILSPQGPKDWRNNQSVITSIFFIPEWLPKLSRLEHNL